MLHSYWPLNRGKNNKRTLIGTGERLRRPFNRGSGNMFGALLNGRLKAGGRLMGGRIIGVRLY